MYLLDTNVICEFRKLQNGRIDPRVKEWMQNCDVEDFYLSAATLSEIQTGILSIMRRDEQQGVLLHSWFEEYVLPEFESRILPIDAQTALMAGALHVPDPRGINDAYIAATALTHRLIVVTRNVQHFLSMRVNVINPWLFSKN